MSKVCKELGIKLANCRSQTIGQQLIKRRPKKSQLQSTGVIYKIKCKDCDHVYIGETKRKLGVRIREHKTSCRNVTDYNYEPVHDDRNDCGTTMHVYNTKHELDFDSVEVLGRERCYTRRKFRERIEICKHKTKTNLMNLMDGKQIDSCWTPFL